jgi:hypothetical protein
MRILAVFVAVLVPVLLVANSTCLTTRISQKSTEKPIEAGDQPNTTVNGNASPAKNNTITGSSEGQRAGGNVPEEKSKTTDEPIPNGAPADTPKDKTTPMVSGDETASANVPPPDGRVYSGGEEPYAYIPTYSRKERLPIMPLPPD